MKPWRLLALGLALGLLAGCGRGEVGPFSPAPTVTGLAGAPPAHGSAAPEFAFTTLDDQRLSLADLRGKAVVLNFWASWCVPCRAEMPYFERTYQAYRERGVIFVGLALQDDPESSRAFVRELGITYPTGPDAGNEIALRYQVTGLPTTVFIRRDGTIARKWTGPLTEQQLLGLVEEIVQ